MLDNELVGLKETLRELEPDRTLSIAKANKIRRAVKAHSARAEQNWSLALFSELPDDTLVRYFTFHQQLIAEALENLAKVSDLTFKHSTCPALNRQLADFASAVLHSLLNHLLDRYRLYVNLDLPAPKYFQQQCCRVWASTWNAVSKLWYEQPFDPPLRALLWLFVEQFEVNPQNLRHSYRTLGYVKELVMQLAGLEAYKSMASWSDAVINMLLNANFNALDFFLYQQQLILDALQALDYREQLDYLHRLQQDYFVHLERNVPPYDARFPSIHRMIYQWCKEEYLLIQQRHSSQRSLVGTPASARKVILDLPASYLACILSLIYTAGWIKGISLTDLFKFTVNHFESKRTATLSWRSLSKEYYSISQQTAARVKEMLQHLIGLIDRQYFPVWAVISAVNLLL